MFRLSLRSLFISPLIRLFVLVTLVTTFSNVYPALAQMFRPSPGLRWHDWFCVGEEICGVGDFNGDGKDDIIAFVRSTQSGDAEGNAWVSLSTGSSFGPAQVWHDWFCVGEEICGVGDFNGDGKDDIIAFVRSTQGGDAEGNAWVSLSTGSSFDPAQVWHDSFCYGEEVCLVGDFNGDGKDDIAALVGNAKTGEGQDDVWVALSTGTSFGTSSLWQGLFPCDSAERCMVGDFNGDGKDDLLTIQDMGKSRGTTFVALSFGTRFDNATVWANPDQDTREAYCSFADPKEVCKVADFDGDGRTDIAMFIRDARNDFPNYVFVGYSTGGPYLKNENTGFWGPIGRHNLMCVGNEVCAVGDVNGDHHADIMAFTRSTKSGDGAGDVWVALYTQ